MGKFLQWGLSAFQAPTGEHSNPLSNLDVFSKEVSPAPLGYRLFAPLAAVEDGSAQRGHPHDSYIELYLFRFFRGGMFSDFILARLTDAAFTEGMLTGSVGALNVLRMAQADREAFDFTSVDSLTVHQMMFAVPVFETVLVEEATTHPGGDGRIEARSRRYRDGRLAWLDALCSLRITAQAEAQTGPVTGIATQSVFERLGDQADMAALQVAFGTIVPPDDAVDVLERLGIRTIEDYRSGRHRIVDVNADPAPSETTTEVVDADLCVQVFDGAAWRDHLRTATLARAILTREFALQPGAAGRRAGVGAAYLAILSGEAVTADPIPGHTPAESEAALATLFRSAGHLVHFDPGLGS